MCLCLFTWIDEMDQCDEVYPQHSSFDWLKTIKGQGAFMLVRSNVGMCLCLFTWIDEIDQWEAKMVLTHKIAPFDWLKTIKGQDELYQMEICMWILQAFEIQILDLRVGNCGAHEKILI